MIEATKDTSGDRSRPLDGAPCTRMSTTKNARKPRLPKIGRHSSGQARVTIGGRVHYLGEYGSPESMVRFAELLKASQQGTIAPAPHAGQVGTIASILASYLDWIEAAGRYMKRGEPTSERDRIRRALYSFEHFAGTRRVADLGEPMILGWRDTLERQPHLTRVGINRQVCKLLACIRWARGRGLVPNAAAASCTMVEPLKRGQCGERPEHGRPRRAVSIEEVDRVADALVNPVHGHLLRFMARTGCRPGEAIHLRWRDIDETPVEVDGTVLWTMRVPVERAKSAHHGRAIAYPLSPAARAILEQQPRGVGGAFVFSLNGKHLCRQHVGEKVKAAALKLGITPYCLHEVRHGAITRAAEVGGVAAAMALANHSRVSTTSRYVHHDPSRAYAAALKLGG